MIFKSDLKGLCRPPYAFTEEGLAMLANVLKTSIASNACFCNNETVYL